MSRMRTATLDDIELVTNLGLKLLHKTPYHNMTADLGAARAWVTRVIQTGVVILAGEHSLIGGVTLQLPFASETVAAELAWGSLKNGLQAAKIEKQLLEAFEYWARNVARVDVIQIGSFHGEKFFLRRGYEKCETMYKVRL